MILPGPGEQVVTGAEAAEAFPGESVMEAPVPHGAIHHAWQADHLATGVESPVKA